MDVDVRLEALEQENERLRDELEALKESLGFRFIAPIEFRLTGMETRCFGRLLKGGLVSKDSMMAALYRDAGNDEAEIKIVDVFVCKLRAKIKPFGIAVRTVWGSGYQMDAAEIAKFHAEWVEPSAPGLAAA